MRPMPRPRPDRDAGITLVVAVMVMGVAATLAVIVLGVAVQSGNDSGRDRQRTVAVNAAEGAVDSAYAQIQSSGTTLPCRWPETGTESFGAAPDATAVYADITYYDVDGDLMDHCPTAADTGSSAPAQAVVDGYATTDGIAGSGTRTRHMQALVNLTPLYAESLTRAIFADGTLTFNNQTKLTGSSGPDADVYTNQSFVCSNNEDFQGSVHSQGGITVSGACTIAGDAWAAGSVGYSGGANGSVGGRVLSSGGTVTLPGNFGVNGSVLAAGAISWPGCSASGKCYPDSTVAGPPYLPFPIINGDVSTLAEWEDSGYTVRVDDDCGDIKQHIIDDYATAGTGTLVRTACPVNFSKDKTIVLQNDLAIFSDGGFSSSQQVSFTSGGTTTRNLYWIVPADATSSRPCTSPGVTTDNQFNFSTTVNMFVYSPCDIAFSNNSDHLGQVYGGSEVNVDNQFSMQYRPLPVFGVDPNSLPLLSYKVDIVYKRENV